VSLGYARCPYYSRGGIPYYHVPGTAAKAQDTAADGSRLTGPEGSATSGAQGTRESGIYVVDYPLFCLLNWSSSSEIVKLTNSESSLILGNRMAIMIHEVELVTLVSIVRPELRMCSPY
jgi:hypothetical protein